MILFIYYMSRNRGCLLLNCNKGTLGTCSLAKHCTRLKPPQSQRDQTTRQEASMDVNSLQLILAYRLQYDLHKSLTGWHMSSHRSWRRQNTVAILSLQHMVLPRRQYSVPISRLACSLRLSYSLIDSFCRRRGEWMTRSPALPDEGHLQQHHEHQSTLQSLSTYHGGTAGSMSILLLTDDACLAIVSNPRSKGSRPPSLPAAQDIFPCPWRCRDCLRRRISYHQVTKEITSLVEKNHLPDAKRRDIIMSLGYVQSLDPPVYRNAVVAYRQIHKCYLLEIHGHHGVG